jgi:hypothetical protein
VTCAPAHGPLVSPVLVGATWYAKTGPSALSLSLSLSRSRSRSRSRSHSRSLPRSPPPSLALALPGSTRTVELRAAREADQHHARDLPRGARASRPAGFDARRSPSYPDAPAAGSSPGGRRGAPRPPAARCTAGHGRRGWRGTLPPADTARPLRITLPPAEGRASLVLPTQQCCQQHRRARQSCRATPGAACTRGAGAPSRVRR